MERPDQTAAASLLHRTCTVFLGHTQTRVDLRRVRPIAVVVYLIRPNRGLTAVLLGKSTTTKAGPPGAGAEFQKEFKKFQSKLNLN